MSIEIILSTKYEGEALLVKAPDADGDLYLNVKDVDGNEISTYLPGEQAQRLSEFINSQSRKTNLL